MDSVPTNLLPFGESTTRSAEEELEEKGTMDEVSLTGRVVTKRKDETGLESVGERMKTKVFPSTIPTSLEDTFSTTTSTSTTKDFEEDDDSDDDGRRSPPFSFQLSPQRVTESSDSAQVGLPNHHTSLSPTPQTSTSSTTTFSQNGEYFGVVDGLTTTGRSNEITEDDRGETSTSGEFIEPFLLDCSDEETRSQGGQARHHHRHGHNSNYNRYQSNRRRRRWRNNNGTGHHRFVAESSGNDNDRMKTSVVCPSKAGGGGESRTHQRRGIWKVGNWSLCETQECFTWNTGRVNLINSLKRYFSFLSLKNNKREVFLSISIILDHSVCLTKRCA